MANFFLSSLDQNSTFDEILKTLYDIVGDSGFVCPAVQTGEFFADNGWDVYHYFFEHRPKNSPWGEWFGE